MAIFLVSALLIELEVRHRREHVQLEASHAASLDVENPRDDREAHAESIEHGDETCPVGQLPRESVDAVHDDPLHLASFDAIEESLEGWPGDGSAAVPFVIEPLGDGIPATPGERPGELDVELALELARRQGDAEADAWRTGLRAVTRSARPTRTGPVGLDLPLGMWGMPYPGANMMG